MTPAPWERASCGPAAAIAASFAAAIPALGS